MFVGVTCHIGFSFLNSYLHVNKGYADSGVQTDAWEDYSDRPSQIIQNSPTSIDTQTPRFSPVESVNTSSQAGLNTTEVGTQTLSGEYCYNYITYT